jgi:hypothetical protein
MPTVYPRILVTRTPRVDDLMMKGRAKLGRSNCPASTVLVELAECGLKAAGDELLIRRATGHVITPDMVAAALDED